MTIKENGRVFTNELVLLVNRNTQGEGVMSWYYNKVIKFHDLIVLRYVTYLVLGLVMKNKGTRILCLE